MQRKNGSFFNDTVKRLTALCNNFSRYGRGSSGIATFATVLDAKNADCHTPPAVLVRGGSTFVRFNALPVGFSDGAIRRYHREPFGSQDVWGQSRCSPFPVYIVYHRYGKKSIGKNAQSFKAKFVQVAENVKNRPLRWKAGGRKIIHPPLLVKLYYFIII